MSYDDMVAALDACRLDARVQVPFNLLRCIVLSGVLNSSVYRDCADDEEACDIATVLADRLMKTRIADAYRRTGQTPPVVTD